LCEGEGAVALRGEGVEDATCWGASGWAYRPGMRVACFYDPRKPPERSLSLLRPTSTGPPLAVVIGLGVVLLFSLLFALLFCALLPEALRLRSAFRMSPSK